MLLNMKEMLTVAKENKFAVGAFNVSDANQFKAIVNTAEKLNAPAIIAIHPDELSFVTKNFCAYVLKSITNSPVPFVLHMDHGGSINDIMNAVNAGFTSVMIDGSLLPFEENKKITKKVVDLVSPLGISVEGELGTIGSTGNNIEGGVTEIQYTKLEDAQEFVGETGVDTLAIAIGTAHGIYPKEFVPKLQLDLLKELSANIENPLVLHGGSSNDDSEIAKAVTLGIQKINISSDMKNAFMTKCREVLENKDLYEPNQVFPECIKAAEDLVSEKMHLFNSVDQAKHYANI